MFHCLRFIDERRMLNDAFGAVIVPHNIMKKMLVSEANRSAVNATIPAIGENLQGLDRA